MVYMEPESLELEALFQSWLDTQQSDPVICGETALLLSLFRWVGIACLGFYLQRSGICVALLSPNLFAEHQLISLHHMVTNLTVLLEAVLHLQLQSVTLEGLSTRDSAMLVANSFTLAVIWTLGAFSDKLDDRKQFDLLLRAAVRHGKHSMSCWSR